MCLVIGNCLTWLTWLVGSKTHDEASGSGNGSKKQQKDERSVERDGDLLLAGSSAGSARSRHGGSVYDLLVAEIKVRADLSFIVQLHNTQLLMRGQSIAETCCSRLCLLIWP